MVRFILVFATGILLAAAAIFAVRIVARPREIRFGTYDQSINSTITALIERGLDRVALVDIRDPNSRCEQIDASTTTVPRFSDTRQSSCSGYYISGAYDAAYYVQEDAAHLVTTSIATFTLVPRSNGEFAINGHAVFDGYYVVEEADPSSFTLIEANNGSATGFDLGYDTHHFFLGPVPISRVQTAGTRIAPLTPLNTPDFYLTDGRSLWYTCVFGVPTCPTENTVSKMNVKGPLPSQLLNRGYDVYGLGYFVDSAGNTYYRGSTYAGLCGYTSKACTHAVATSSAAH